MSDLGQKRTVIWNHFFVCPLKEGRGRDSEFKYPAELKVVVVVCADLVTSALHYHS
jgi:hypothetical protein